MKQTYKACLSRLRPRPAATKTALILQVLALTLPAGAVGTRLPNQDPEGIARGNAFAATADNASAIYYNPAGITQLDGFQAQAGMYLISADTSYTSPKGVKAETDATPQPVPQLYVVDSLQSAPLSFGLGIYAPYGLGMNWGDNSPFRTLAERGKVLYACVNPVGAWRINSTLSIAIGPTINYSQATLKQGFSTLNPTDSFRFDGDDLDFGFNAGVRWQPLPQLAFGINYRSATTLDYHGTSETSPQAPFPYYPPTSTHAAVKFPQFAVGGISYRPTEDWNFEFDLDWTDWDSVKEIDFKGTPLGTLPFVLNFRSSFMYEFGVTRQIGNGYFVSLGYFYSENSSPDKNYNPIIPDANLHLGGLGLGHHGQRWDWQVAYQVAYNPGRQVVNDVNPLADGTYRAFNNAINVSVTFKF